MTAAAATATAVVVADFVNNTNLSSSTTTNTTNSLHTSSHGLIRNDTVGEEMVQAWLDTNKGWFQLYAIENLDANTVEKWLRSQGKRVCKCKNPSAETMMSNSLGESMVAARGKRNSIGFIPVIDDITGKE